MDDPLVVIPAIPEDRWTRARTWFVAGLGCTALAWAGQGVVMRVVRRTSPEAWLQLTPVLRWLVPALAATGVLLFLLARHRNARWPAFVLGAATPYVLGFVLLSAPAIGGYLQRRDFDAVAWKQAAGRRSDDRLRMVDDLLRSRRLVGLTRAEVLEILGPTAAGRHREGDFVYWLGPERGWFSVDSEWLTVRFDAEGRVVAALVTRD